jgi:hypothetical protein
VTATVTVTVAAGGSRPGRLRVSSRLRLPGLLSTSTEITDSSPLLAVATVTGGHCDRHGDRDAGDDSESLVAGSAGGAVAITVTVGDDIISDSESTGPGPGQAQAGCPVAGPRLPNTEHAVPRCLAGRGRRCGHCHRRQGLFPSHDLVSEAVQ